MSTRRRLMNLQPDGTYRQAERVQIEANNLGSYTLRVDGRDEPYTGVGATWIDADNAVGEDVTVGFVQGESTLPVMFSRGSKPNSKLVMARQFVDFFSGWTRHGIDLLGRFLLSGVDDGDDTTVVMNGTPPETSEDGDIVRTYNGLRIIAEGQTIRSESEETGQTVEGPTDLGGDIAYMCVDSSGTVRSVLQIVNVVVVDCDDVYDEAYDQAIEDAGIAFVDGQSACLFGGGDYQSELDDYFNTYLDDTPVPDEYSDCSDEWEAGLLEGYEANFLDGYQEEGCSP